MITPTPAFQLGQELLNSAQNVARVDGFLVFFSLIVTTGMFIGIRLDDGSRGLRRSLVILVPFILLQTLTNISRVYQNFNQQMASQSFNGTTTMVLTSFAYILGLVIGHLIFKRAKKDVNYGKSNN